jgi:hypothetical protein
MKEAAAIIQEEAHEDANIIFGWVVDEEPGRRGAGHGHRHRYRQKA